MQHVQRDRTREKEKIGRDEIDLLIDQWIIGRRAERNRAILRRKIYDGITYEELADEFDMSVRQVKNIVYKYGDLIYKKAGL